MILASFLLLPALAQTPDSYAELIRHWHTAAPSEQTAILSRVEKFYATSVSSTSAMKPILERDLPDAITRMKLVFRRHRLAHEDRVESYFRVVGFFKGPDEVTEFTLRSDSLVLIDKKGKVGEVRRIPSGEGFSAVPAPGVIPKPGLFQLNIRLKSGAEFSAEFFVLETLPTESPQVESPSEELGLAAGFPTIRWKPFFPKDTRSFYRRETFVSLATVSATFKDTLWERLLTQPSLPNPQVVEEKVEDKDSHLPENGLRAGQRLKFLLTQLEENVLLPQFFVSRESTVEFPVEVKD